MLESYHENVTPAHFFKVGRCHLNTYLAVETDILIFFQIMLKKPIYAFHHTEINTDCITGHNMTLLDT